MKADLSFLNDEEYDAVVTEWEEYAEITTVELMEQYDTTESTSTELYAAENNILSLVEYYYQMLLKYAKCLCDQLHYQNPWSTSSITLYKGDTILDDLFLNGLNTRYKHMANRWNYTLTTFIPCWKSMTQLK